MQEGDGLTARSAAALGTTSVALAEADGMQQAADSDSLHNQPLDEGLLHSDADGALRAWFRGRIRQFHKAHSALFASGLVAAGLAAAANISSSLLQRSHIWGFSYQQGLWQQMELVNSLSVALSAVLLICAAAALTAMVRSTTVPDELLLANDRRSIYRVQLAEARRGLFKGPLTPIILLATVAAIAGPAFSSHFTPAYGLLSAVISACSYLPWLYFLAELQIGITLRYPPRMRNNLAQCMPALLGLLAVSSSHIGAMTLNNAASAAYRPVYATATYLEHMMPALTLLSSLAAVPFALFLWNRALRSLSPLRLGVLMAGSVFGYLLLSAALLDLSAFRSYLLWPACFFSGLNLGSMSAFGANRGLIVDPASMAGRDWTWIPQLSELRLYVLPDLSLPLPDALTLLIIYYSLCIWFIRRANDRMPDGWRGIWED